MLHSLRARVTLGLAAVALSAAVVSTAAITSLARLGGAIAMIMRENYRSVIACDDMKEALERQDSAAQFASTGHYDVARPMLATHRAGFDRAFRVEAHNLTVPGEGALVAEIGVHYRDYVATVDRVLAAPPGPERVEMYFRDLLPRFTALKARIERVLRVNQASMERADRETKALARRSIALAVALGAAAALLACGFAWLLPRTIVGPVRTLAAAARAIGDGDLDVSVQGPTLAELEPVAEAFRKMSAQLRAYRASSLGELLAAKDLANATVACLVDPVVVLDARGGVLLTNAAAERTFGLRAGDPDELRAAGVAVPDAFAAARDTVFATGAPAAPANFKEALRWRDRAGERYFLVRAAPLQTEPGGAPRAIVVAQDVTRLRRIDALKSDMVATVSHEFKTPLTSLRMATHLLLEPGTGPLGDAQREIVTAARDDTERLRALVDELLDLVRIETEAGALHRVAVDPRRLLDGAAAAHRTIARDKGVGLEVEPTEDLGTAYLDAEKVAIVLANLVSNAIRHTPPGGRVVLGAAADARDLRITVRDTGEGMPAAEFAKFFDRDDGPRSGTSGAGRHGLGLTIAKEIVLQHGGEVLVESAAGHGTTFAVVLPRERRSEPAASPTHAVAASGTT